MQKYTNNFTDTTGAAIGGATVSVYTYPDGLLARLYSTMDGGAVKANPLTTDSLGYFEFYAADGRYTITITSPVTQPVTISDILLEDPADNIDPLFKTGNQSPTPGVKMKIDFLLEQSTFQLEDEAGIWPNATYSYMGLSKEFTVNTLPTGGPAPVSTLFAFANSNGSTADVVAVLGDAVARQGNSVVFGANFIARNGAGVNGAKLVGLEIDLEPAAGTTIAAGSIGLAINAFSIDTGAPAVQLGGLGGGTFSNGIIINAVKGAALAAQTGSTAMQSLIDASQGTYNSDAIILGNGHKIRLMGTGTTHAKLYNDAADNVRMVLGTGAMVIRNSADTTSLFTFDSLGIATLSAVKVGASQIVGSRRTGWSAPVGIASRASFDTATATTAELAQRMKALVDDLTTHGLIGA